MGRWDRETRYRAPQGCRPAPRSGPRAPNPSSAEEPRTPAPTQEPVMPGPQPGHPRGPAAAGGDDIGHSANAGCELVITSLRCPGVNSTWQRIMTDVFRQILDNATLKSLGAETGGGHNNKGNDFQKHWAITRMFELTDAGEEDFLLLFESLQDVAILDSQTAPTRICVYQVKKKDRLEWDWADLTCLHLPNAKRNIKPLSEIKSSVIGKLYATVKAITDIHAAGRFISNAPCDLALSNNNNAATSLPVSLDQLAAEHLRLLTESLKLFHDQDLSQPLSLANFYIERVDISPSDPKPYVIGIAHQFLEKRSPRHAGQARALVDALLISLAPLNAKTDKCHNFSQLCSERGFSKREFESALVALEAKQDLLHHLSMWLNQLQSEGVGLMDITATYSSASRIFKWQLLGTMPPDEQVIMDHCDTYLNDTKITGDLRPHFEDIWVLISSRHEWAKRHDVYAHFALQAIKRCVD